MENIFFTLKGIIDKYKIPPVSEIRNVFETASETEYIAFTEFLIVNNKKEEFEIFLYYLILFRDINTIQSALNSEMMPPDLLQHLIMFSFGYTAMKNGAPDKILDELFYFLSQEKLLQLILTANYISRDMFLVTFILTRLDIKHIETFFTMTENAEKIIKTFIALPENQITEIIYRNASLFDKFLSIVPMYTDDNESEKFYEKYAELIEKMHAINLILKKYITHKSEFSKQILSRIALIVTMLDRLGDARLTLDQYIHDEIFGSETEKLLAYEIISNPLYKKLLLKINNSCFFDNEFGEYDFTF